MTTGSIDGFAMQNTAWVLCALLAYERAAEKDGPAAATERAMEVYESLSQKRVTDRTVRRWLLVVRTYGGIEKTPRNAFGARKSCLHLKRPIKERLRQMQELASELGRRAKREGWKPSQLAELAVLDSALAECLRSILNNPAVSHLASIRTAARRLETMPVHRLCRYISATETERSLEELLARLKAVAINQSLQVLPLP